MPARRVTCSSILPVQLWRGDPRSLTACSDPGSIGLPRLLVCLSSNPELQIQGSGDVEALIEALRTQEIAATDSPKVSTDTLTPRLLFSDAPTEDQISVSVPCSNCRSELAVNYLALINSGRVMTRKISVSSTFVLFLFLLVVVAVRLANAEADKSLAAWSEAGSNSGEDATQSKLSTSTRAADGGPESVLYSFCSQTNCSDGRVPEAGVIEASDGNFYGTTWLGGTKNAGTAFKLTSAGVLTTLYSFCSKSNCSDGRRPRAALIQGSDGNFYGTTTEGGVNGNGTVFRLTPTGILTTLYKFCSQANCTDGWDPEAALIQGSDGNFYGTTQFGGATEGGTVFKLTPGGVLTTLYSFCSQANCDDGFGPEAALIQANDGNFYGTTARGGADISGTAFRITSTGVLTTLYKFCSQTNCSDGSDPEAALIQANDGNFYGATTEGGAYEGGTVFKLTPDGVLNTLYSFCSQGQPYCADGSAPGDLIQGSDGNFYGTTWTGGAYWDGGTVFKLTLAGALTTLYSFCSQANCSDGGLPEGGVIQGSDGNFYGTTASGRNDAGTVFELSIHPAFFNGEVSVGNGLYYLNLPHAFFGYYSYQYYPWLYHYWLGFDYVFGNPPGSSLYLYDPSLTATLFTDPDSFPYFYDFQSNSWLWYYTGTSRWFYDFGTRGLFFSPPG